MKKLITVVATLIAFANYENAYAYTINGHYARLISCDWGYSVVRGESGYTGTYEVYNEIWTVYFGSTYCKY